MDSKTSLSTRIIVIVCLLYIVGMYVPRVGTVVLEPRSGSSSCRSLLPQMIPLSRSWSGKWWARFNLA